MYGDTSLAVSFLPISMGFAFTILVCLFAPSVGKMLGLLDDPAAKLHSRHIVSTPLVGGVAILTPVIVLALIGGLFVDMLPRPSYWQLGPRFALSVAAMMLLGMADDRFQLTAQLRLVAAAVVFFVLVTWSPALRIETFGIPLLTFSISVSLGLLGIPFAVLCLVALANAINMADGRNGLVIGMCLIWTLALILRSPAYYPLGMLMMFSSLLVTFICNLRGRLFLGDGGTYGLAAFFGLSAIWFHNLPGGALSEAQIGALFLIPMLDMVRLIVTRLRRGASPFAADHDHLHHYLDDWLGWDRGLLLYLGLVAVPVMAAFIQPRLGGESLVLGTALYLLIFTAARSHSRQNLEVPGIETSLAE